jgi:hypothetical protein
MKPRKHAELIKAWADGATIERLWNDYNGRVSSWLIDNEPDWSEFEEYRIKPEPTPEPKKYKVYIYNDMSKGTTWVDARNPSEFTPHKNYMYMGSIEVDK